MLSAEEQRLWNKVDKRGPDECWLWVARRDRHGYGRYTQYLAHRVIYERYKGPLKKGACVCHSCDNRACVNPAHLWLGTPAENMADMVAKGRSRRGEKCQSTKLTAEQVIEINRQRSGPARLLAEKYGVSIATIWRIRHGATWPDLQLKGE